MIIDLSKINKRVFKRILGEENERDEFTRRICKRRIDEGHAKDVQDTYNLLINKKKYFESIMSSLNKINEINVSEEEMEYFKLLTGNQKYISRFRINDLWAKPDGEMYRRFHNQCVNVQGQSEEEFEKAYKEVIDYDIKNIKCCDILINMLSIKFD